MRPLSPSFQGRAKDGKENEEPNTTPHKKPFPLRLGLWLSMTSGLVAGLRVRTCNPLVATEYNLILCVEDAAAEFLRYSFELLKFEQGRGLCVPHFSLTLKGSFP